MTPEEIRYKSTAMRLGFTMLFFLALFFVYSGVISVANMITERGVAGEIVYQLCYGVFYAVCFILPVFFFGWISKGKPREKIPFRKSIPREFPFYLFFAMAAIFTAAYLNSLLLEVFHFSDAMEDMMGFGSVSAGYEIILMVFTTAVVPAFVEELLFRGLILNNLLPYGKVTAVVGSAFLFGMMHQNPGQFLYATVAGLVFGYVFLKTGSIFCTILIHFINNFFSVMQVVWSERLSPEGANAVIGVTELLIIALGLLSFLYLALHAKDRKRELRLQGAFLREVEEDEGYVPVSLPWRRRIRLFFNVPMIFFCIICVLEMLFLLAASMLGFLA